MQAITTIGLDIAKSVFQVHGVDAQGRVIIRRQLKRRYVLAFFQKLPVCLVGIEACASSHHWSRELQALGRRLPDDVLPMIRNHLPIRYSAPPTYFAALLEPNRFAARPASGLCNFDHAGCKISRPCSRHAGDLAPVRRSFLGLSRLSVQSQQ